jgi:ABC-type branched-subunit amino acid transport system substrate-binding protein
VGFAGPCENPAEGVLHHEGILSRRALRSDGRAPDRPARRLHRAQAPQEIVIGVIYPLSGNLAQIGIDSVTAIRVATEIFNG